MSATNFTPIQLYRSTTASQVPVDTNLLSGELAINTTDEKLYFKNTSGTVKLLASTAVFTTTGSGSYVLATTPTFVNGININSIYVGDGTGATYGNTIVGAGAMYHARTLGATEWNDNLAAGANALHYITQGTGNVAIGSRALYMLSTGNYNVAIGHHALYYANNVSYFTNSNTAIGASAGRDVTTGTFNVFIGSSSGLEVTTGDSNVIIGGDYGTDIQTLSGHIILSDGVGNRRLHYDAGNVLWNFGSAHVTLEGVTSTGATGTGKFVFDSAPTITGHPTIEGVTSTGATGTGKFVFDSAPTITGHPTIEGVTSTGATGTGKFMFDSAPTITGHPTIEGVTSTGATGTGKFVFDSSPTLSGVTLSDGTANGVAYLNGSKVLTSSSGFSYTPSTSQNTLYIEGVNSTGIFNAIGSSYPGVQFKVSGAYKSGISNDSDNLTFDSNGGTAHRWTFGGTEQMRLTSTGLGIGTSSPVTILDVGSTFSAVRIFLPSTTDTYHQYHGTPDGSGYEHARVFSGRDASVWTYGSYLAFYTEGKHSGTTDTSTEKMRIDSSGNLGLGVVPSEWALRTMQVGGFGALSGDSNTVALSQNVYGNVYSGYGAKYAVSGQTALTFNLDKAAGAFKWYTAPSGTAGNAISFTQAMTLDASGNLMVGTTTANNNNSTSFAFNIQNGNQYCNHINGTGSGTGYIQFSYNGDVIGSITQNGTTGVLYNIISDYRLKNIVGPVIDSGTRIDALEPVEYTMKSDGSVHKGFLAHKFQEVYPNSVSGEKDAVDMNGKPVYQNMQASTSEVIADLVAELQSLRKRVNQLENK